MTNWATGLEVSIELFCLMRDLEPRLLLTRSKQAMAWQLQPPPEVQQEIDRMGELELMALIAQLRSWIDSGEWDDLALARAIEERGHSEDFSYWLLKEVRIRESEKRR